jgi:hypothetical protein
LYIEHARVPVMTIRVGGMLDAAVTITAIGMEERLHVEASWNRDGNPRSTSIAVDGAAAQALAHQWADQLAAGGEPTS